MRTMIHFAHWKHSKILCAQYRTVLILEQQITIDEYLALLKGMVRFKSFYPYLARATLRKKIARYVKEVLPTYQTVFSTLTQIRFILNQHYIVNTPWGLHKSLNDCDSSFGAMHCRWPNCTGGVTSAIFPNFPHAAPFIAPPPLNKEFFITSPIKHHLLNP